MYQRGNAIGKISMKLYLSPLTLIIAGAESKGLGVHVQLGPVAGPLGKNAQVILLNERNNSNSY